MIPLQNCSSPSVGVDAVFSGQLAHLQLWNTSLTPTDVITLGASPSALSYLPSGRLLVEVAYGGARISCVCWLCSSSSPPPLVSTGLPNATLILSLSATEPDYEARVWIDASSYSNSVTFGHTLPGLSCPPQAVTFSPGPSHCPSSATPCHGDVKGCMCQSVLSFSPPCDAMFRLRDGVHCTKQQCGYEASVPLSHPLLVRSGVGTR